MAISTNINKRPYRQQAYKPATTPALVRLFRHYKNRQKRGYGYENQTSTNAIPENQLSSCFWRLNHIILAALAAGTVVVLLGLRFPDYRQTAAYHCQKGNHKALPLQKHFMPKPLALPMPSLKALTQRIIRWLFIAVILSPALALKPL